MSIGYFDIFFKQSLYKNEAQQIVYFMLHVAALTRHTGGGIASAGQGTLNPVNNFFIKREQVIK